LTIPSAALDISYANSIRIDNADEIIIDKLIMNDIETNVTNYEAFLYSLSPGVSFQITNT
jgi:hypothetical protein